MLMFPRSSRECVDFFTFYLVLQLHDVNHSKSKM